jgi:hypothetical protein
MTVRTKRSRARRGREKSGGQTVAVLVSADVLNYFADTIPGPRDETPFERQARIAKNRKELRSYSPRDAMEAMFASQCIVLRMVFVDCARDYYSCTDPAEREELKKQATDLAETCREAHDLLPEWSKRRTIDAIPLEFVGVGLETHPSPAAGTAAQPEPADIRVIAFQHPAPKMLQ